MPHEAPRTILGKLRDEARFIREWLEHPLQTGAISPSSPALARAMAAFIDPAETGRVLELGPGTGAVTEAILERGVAPADLTSLEYNPDFARLLEGRFAGIDVKIGDAYDLDETLGPDDGSRSFKATVSSLPLFTRPLEDRQRLLDAALDRMPAGAPFIQFSYALVPPVKAEPGRWTVSKTGWIVLNLPPARVWVYRRPTGA